MADRVTVSLAVSRDQALPVDVQGVGLRRRAIQLMQEVATVDENTVRYRGGTDGAVLTFGDETLSMWQMDLVGVRYTADGEALDGVVGPVVHKDFQSRVYSSAEVVRDL